MIARPPSVSIPSAETLASENFEPQFGVAGG
jgi:hypothetical protein